MATIYDIAESLASFLREEPLLDDVEIVAINEDKPRSAYLDASRKKNGEMSILWMDSPNEKREAGNLVPTHKYEARIIMKPVLREGRTGIQDAAEIVAKRIHGWTPKEDGRHCMFTATVTGIFPFQVESFSARRIPFEILFPL